MQITPSCTTTSIRMQQSSQEGTQSQSLSSQVLSSRQLDVFSVVQQCTLLQEAASVGQNFAQLFHQLKLSGKINNTTCSSKEKLIHLIQEDLSSKGLPAVNYVPQEELQLVYSQAFLSLRTQDLSKVVLSASSAIIELARSSSRAVMVGNKAANLERLQHIFQNTSGVCIPEFVGISHEDVLEYLRSNCLEFETLWGQFVKHIEQEGGSIESGVKILTELQVVIEKAFSIAQKFPDETILKPFFDRGVSLMVRSTGLEDSLKLANPGGNTSVSSVAPRREDIACAVGKVVSSYFSPKSLGQRQAVGDNITRAPFMPVLLQVMVGETTLENIPISGVMYTTEGDLNTFGVAQINATLGHAEGVVTGTEPCDIYYAHGDFVHGIVREKTSRKAPQKEGGLVDVANPREKRRHSSLSENQVKKLAEIGRRIEESYGYPMDVEWSFDQQKNVFYIFQARPISQKERPQPTYIDPNAIKGLIDVRQVSVIGAAGGSVATLTKENTLIADSGPEAEALFLKHIGLPPKAIFLARTTAATSHEAGFFRERGIPVIHVGGEILSTLTEILKKQTVLLDTQESFIATLPEGREAKTFIISGLRRHLAPKMESILVSVAPADAHVFKDQLLMSCRGIDKRALWEKLESPEIFGWNLLDKILGAFEMATSEGERAFFLSCLLDFIEERLFPKIPEKQRKGLKNKILYDAMHVWAVYQDPRSDDACKKFAMNWMRTTIIQTPAEDVVNGDTLVVALLEVKERKLFYASKPSSLDDEFRDILLRMQKYVLHQFNRWDWIDFIKYLSPTGLRALGAFLVTFGPQVVAVWVNTEFVKAWSAVLNRSKLEAASMCLISLLNRAGQKNVSEALTLAKRAETMACRFQKLSNSFSDPSQFEELFRKLREELLPEVVSCLEYMKGEIEFGSTISAHAFLSLVSSYDNCIKGLTRSELYQGKQELKADRFSSLLEGYLALSIVAMDISIFRDNPVLCYQAEALRDYLPEQFRRMKEKINGKAEEMLLPSKDFSAAMASLGSGMWAPERSHPTSLEDLFTLLHQSLITVAQHIGRRSGIPVKALPPELKYMCEKLSEIWLCRSVGVLSPIIQCIEYDYPTVQVRFNCPLKVHSAQFTLVATVDARGSLTSVDFEGNFFCPINGIGLFGRSEELTMYAAGTYYGEKAMQAPPNRSMKPMPSGTVQFCWRIYSSSHNDVDTQLNRGIEHLQKMILYLQTDNISFDQRNLPVYVPEEQLQQILLDHPWIISNIVGVCWDHMSRRKRGKITEAFIKSVLEHYSEENLLYFFKYFFLMLKEFPNNSYFIKMRDKLFETEAFWTNQALIKHSLPFFTMINVDYYKEPRFMLDQDRQVEALEIIPLTAEQKKKIASIILNLPPENLGDDYLEVIRRKEFEGLYKNYL